MKTVYTLIENYKRYLEGAHKSNGKSYKASTIKEYCRALRLLLDGGYTERALCANVDKLIIDYSKDGVCYDPDDRGDTVAALKKLKDYFATCKIA